MNLKDGLPTGFEARGLVVKVRTGAAWWMWVSCRMLELDDQAGMVLLEQGIESIERNGEEVSSDSLNQEEIKTVFDRMLWFMRGGAEEARQTPRGSKQKERLLDYEKDLDALYAAFMQTYGLDLYAKADGKFLIDTLHWWRFLALVNNLSPGSMLVDYYMHYRGVDVNKLPAKTPADRKHKQEVMRIKALVALDTKPQERKKAEPSYARKARELKAKGVKNV